MNDLGPWNINDFEQMSWHDVHVYGFKLENFITDEGTSDLVFDIDYILKWEKSNDQFRFLISRAELRFHDVFGLKMDLDYTKLTAGMSPFSIDGIERELLEFQTGYKSYQWKIPINWPSGSFEFQAPNFSQKLTGKLYKQNQQVLISENRNNENT